MAYDFRNQSFRIIEPLLYRSPFYEPSAQSFVFSTARGDDRPFIFSTPRLYDENSFHWQTRFDSAAVDRLFKLRSTPAPYCEILEPPLWTDRLVYKRDEIGE